MGYQNDNYSHCYYLSPPKAFLTSEDQAVFPGMIWYPFSQGNKSVKLLHFNWMVLDLRNPR